MKKYLLSTVLGFLVAGPALSQTYIAGTFSAAGFTPSSVGTPIAASASGATGTLPAGSVVVATNVGTTNGAYCALGSASSTSQQYIAPNGGWFAFTIPNGANQMTCVTSSSTTTINLVGGSGLATGAVGGGAGGGGGGSSTAVLGTSNGWTPFLDNAQSTIVKTVKSSPGQLGMLQCYNPNPSQIYVQIFNNLSGAVALGSSTPTLSIPIAATAAGGWALSNPGIYLSTAISLAVTTTATGSAAPSIAPDCNVAFN